MVRQDSPHINASRTTSSVGCFLHDDIKQTTSQCGEAAEHFDVYLQLDFSSTWTKHPEGSVWNADAMNMEVHRSPKAPATWTATFCQKLCDDYSDGNVCKRFTYSPDEVAPEPTCILQISSPEANAKLTYDVNAIVLGTWAYERASVTCASATTVTPTPIKSTCNPLLSMPPPSTPCFPETYNKASCKIPDASGGCWENYECDGALVCHRPPDPEEPGKCGSAAASSGGKSVTAPAEVQMTSVSAAALCGLRVSV